jgi:hypothetical protein
MSKDTKRTLKEMSRRGVVFSVLDKERALPLWGRLVEEYLDPQKREKFCAILKRSPKKRESLEYATFLRPACTIDVTTRLPQLLVSWLTSNGAHGTCYRFDQRTTIPICALEVHSLDPAIATSWPGLYVEFEAGRALAITLDAERFSCDIRSGARDR